MSTVSMSLLHDDSPRGTGLFYVDVTIDGTEHRLGCYADITDAVVRMKAWIDGRGLVWAPDSARRISECQRTDGPLLILDVWTRAAYAAHVEKRRTAWQRVDHEPYAHTAFRMGTRDEFPWLNTDPMWA
jgi:hypothetical protein